MTADQDPRLVELPVRLSSSKLWQIQRNYFTNMGIRAWKEEVPFYISSNAFIGQRYAMLALSYIKDWLALHPTDRTKTFYFLEVGSGTGKFSFYMLKALKALLAEHKMDDIQFCYVISDLVEKNISFCLENQSLQPYVQSGELDFCLFDVEQDNDFELQLKKRKFSELNVQTPLIVIANYTFDCIKQDEFEFEKDTFYEIKLGIKSRYKHFDVDKAMHLDDLRLHFEREEVPEIENYYDDIQLNQILKDYPALFNYKKSRIAMPLGAFQFFDNLKKMSHAKTFVILGDKGLSQPSLFPLYEERNRFSYDGCYSFLVNFHAIGEYIKRKGGDYLLTENCNDFKVNLYSMGASIDDLPLTKSYFEDNIQAVGPEEFVYFYDEYLSSSFRFSPKALLSFVRLSEWDPNAYAVIHERLIQALPNLTRQFIEDLKVDLNKIVRNVYAITIGDDVLNLVGICHQMLGEDEQAIDLYNQSLVMHGDKSAPHNNLGLIYEKQKNTAKAIYHYEKSVALDKYNYFAKKRLLHLSGKPYLLMIMPIIKGLFVLSIIGGALYLLSR